MYQDHIVVNKTFPILRTQYFRSRLADLPHFDGFSPRWILPQIRMVKTDDHAHEKIATLNMLTIDSKNEIKIFSPLIRLTDMHPG